MTPAQQVDKQLQSDFDKFYNSAYAGKVEVPKDILAKFKTAIMSLPVQSHKINSNKIKAIAEKKVAQLSCGDINDVIKVIVNTPPEKMYADFDKAVDGMIKFEKFILCYNEFIDEFQKKLEMKRATLMSLSGANVSKSSMRILN